jgi:hypothetical protein
MSTISVEPPEVQSHASDGAIFVDQTGVRRRVWAVLGTTVSLAALAYLALLVAAVLTSTGPGSAS